MIVLADSGSTKVSWRLIADGAVQSIETAGINASYTAEEKILSILKNELLPHARDVSEIHFFGAGVLPGAPSDLLRRLMGEVWPGATVELESDIVVAAKALLGHNRGIACILGTGSNSCLWDGTGVEAGFYGGGYLLGDEGSGNWIGKAILSDFAKNLLPEDLREDFVKEYGHDYFSLVKELYNNPLQGKYLASYAMFATKWKQHPYIQETVRRGFDLFLSRNVLRYEGCREVETGFVGSVAAVFHEQLEQSCEAAGLRLGKIVRGPIDELVKYYI